MVYMMKSLAKITPVRPTVPAPFLPAEIGLNRISSGRHLSCSSNLYDVIDADPSELFVQTLEREGINTALLGQYKRRNQNWSDMFSDQTRVPYAHPLLLPFRTNLF